MGQRQRCYLHIIGKIGVDGALYKSMEFAGAPPDDGRPPLHHNIPSCRAKNGIFPVDDLTLRFIADHSKRKPVVFAADADAEYDSVMEIDLSQLRSTVAFPHLPSNTRTFDQIPETRIDQVVIGSCTNGRLSDLQIAAEILKGRKVNKRVRTLIIPATQKIWLDAMQQGLLEIFVKAGCAVSTPTCGPCLGGHMGILAKGERALATTNRNFVGRMGHPESEVYLSSPEVAAASALTGVITDPATL